MGWLVCMNLLNASCGPRPMLQWAPLVARVRRTDGSRQMDVPTVLVAVRNSPDTFLSDDKTAAEIDMMRCVSSISVPYNPACASQAEAARMHYVYGALRKVECDMLCDRSPCKLGGVWL